MSSRVCFLLLFFIIISSSALSTASTTTTQQLSSCISSINSFPNNKEFASCVDLPTLDSSLYWTFYPSSSAAQIAYRHSKVTSTNWVAWGINPTSKGMVGTQALIAYQNPNDGTMSAYTSPINSYGTQMSEGELSFKVSDLSATFANNEEVMIIYATVELPSNTTVINHVWQDGPISAGNSLGMHGLSGQHLQSMGTLDLSSGISVPPTKARRNINSKDKLRKIHGALNVVSWGTMMPIGFLLARYLKAFQSSDPLWFYLHVSCQCSAFIVGIVGWATGIALRVMSSSSIGVHHTDHMAIGTTTFFLGILQVLALRLRPNKDHNYRYYWNIYHHYVGYVVLALGIANVFIGYRILKPDKRWEIAYYVVFGILLFALVLLEACKRYLQMKKKSTSQGHKNDASEDEVAHDHNHNAITISPQEEMV